jgi:hypothetical protein
MLFRALFAFLFVLLLLPHEPNLGLPQAPRGSLDTLLQSAHRSFSLNLRQAALEIRSSDPSPLALADWLPLRANASRLANLPLHGSLQINPATVE